VGNNVIDPLGNNVIVSTGDSVFAPLAVSPRKAARYLDVGHDAIYQLLNDGRLRSVKLGRRRLIPMTELHRFLTDELA
jgi:excisionase family DNA binding protein